jgi:hypothetical protein
MSLLERAIKGRLDDVDVFVENNPEVIIAKRDLNNILGDLLGNASPKDPFAGNLSDALDNINHLVSMVTSAAYRFGVHDGFQLRDELAQGPVNPPMIGGEK